MPLIKYLYKRQILDIFFHPFSQDYNAHHFYFFQLRRKLKQLFDFTQRLCRIEKNVCNGTCLIQHTQGTREMCRIVQDVGILRFYFS